MYQSAIVVLAVVYVLALGGPVGGMGRPGAAVFVPWFEVDPDFSGPTTVFAVRNASPTDSVLIDLFYQNAEGSAMLYESFLLGPEDTLTRNIRQVIGELDLDSDGLARGRVLIRDYSGLTGSLVGDYFQVDVANAYASGGRLANTRDACRWIDVRFLQGGGFTAGTELIVNVLNSSSHPPGEEDFWIYVYDEDGTLQSMIPYFLRPRKMAKIRVADLAYPDPVPFGTIKIRFHDAITGHACARLNATGMYSVTVEGICLDPVMPP